MTDSMQSSKYKKDEGWCSKSLLRNYLYIFNIFFLIGGGVVLGVGIWSVLAEHSFISLLSSVSYPLTSYLLIAAGVVVLIAVVIGCSGIKRKDRCFLLVYILLLLLVFVLEFLAGGLAYVYRGQAYSDLQTRLNDTFTEQYDFDATKTAAIDDMHREFRCCGALSSPDWQYSRWMTSGKALNNSVPDSCCRTYSVGCGRRSHPSNIYAVGCINKLTSVVTNHLGYLAIAGLGLCILQIFGIIFSSCLYIKLRDPDITDL